MCVAFYNHLHVGWGGMAPQAFQCQIELEPHHENEGVACDETKPTTSSSKISGQPLTSNARSKHTYKYTYKLMIIQHAYNSILIYQHTYKYADHEFARQKCHFCFISCTFLFEWWSDCFLLYLGMMTSQAYPFLEEAYPILEDPSKYRYIPKMEDLTTVSPTENGSCQILDFRRVL